MNGDVFVLMYHRVCERNPHTACWFERGTAVTPASFEAQMNWLRPRVRFVTLDEALFEGAYESAAPRCVVSFDDGYRDALVAAHMNVPVTIFAVANHLGDSAEPLWFDRYYDILHRARRRGGVRSVDLGMPCEGDAPAIDTDLRWWVRGPLKEHLQRLPHAERARALHEVSETLEVDGCTSARDFYLSLSELRMLSAEGHRVGGHGATHTRLPLLDDDALAQELAASQALLDAVASAPPRLFCYPDGAHDARVLAATRRTGFFAACTVERGIWRRETNALEIPRVLMRDVLPGTARWPVEFSTL